MPRRNAWQIGGGEVPEKPSRTQKKRDSTALQKAGEALANLPLAKLEPLSLPEDLKKALADCSTMKSYGARRRQLQYIGRLMREAQEEGRLDSLPDAIAVLERPFPQKKK